MSRNQAEPFTVVTDAPLAVEGLFRIAFDVDGVRATLPPPAHELRIPRRFLADPAAPLVATLDYDGVKWTLLAGGQRDVDYVAAPVALPAGADLSPFPKRPLPEPPDARPVTRPIQYWTPDDWNAWVGDVVLANWKGRIHVFYLFDRRHHQSKEGRGGHYFAHLSSPDLVRWEEHPPAVLPEERWEYIGTGTPFDDGDRLLLFYGLHTFRHVPAEKTSAPEQAAYLAAHGREGVFPFDALKGLPAGGTYAATTDGVHFAKSRLLVTSDQNPSPFRMADGRIGLQRSAFAGERGLWTSDRLSGWAFDSDTIPTHGDCPCPFIWNGWHYILQGFVGMAASPTGAPGTWEDWVLSGDDIYDGLSVPMVVPYGKGRRLIAGWIIHPEGWGGWLCFRELVQYPDGRLGMKWVPEIAPPTAPLVFRAAPDRPFVLRFAPEAAGAPDLEFRIDPAEGRAQFADAPDAGPAPRRPTLSAFMNDWARGIRPKRNPSRPDLCGDVAIGHIRSLDAPFGVRLVAHYDPKADATIFDAEIAGQRTILCRRRGRYSMQNAK